MSVVINSYQSGRPSNVDVATVIEHLPIDSEDTPPTSAAERSCPQEHAESARGVSPRAAHRTVREPLDSHGSCHPRRLPPPAERPGSSCCQLTKQFGAGDLLPSLHGHYLASSLLQSSPPLVSALVLSASPGIHLYLSLSITDPVLTFRTKAQMRVMPPIHRTPHGQ